MTVSWTAPADTGGNPITGYQVEWAEAATGPWNDATANTEADEDPETAAVETQYTHTGLTPSTAYHYRVSTLTETGPSEPSTSVSATTADLPTVTVAVGPKANPKSSVTEGTDGAARFTVIRTGDKSEVLIVQLNVTEVGTFVHSSDLEAQVTFIGAGATDATFLALIENDATDESDGSVTVEVKAPAEEDFGNGYTIGTNASATIIIVDEDVLPSAPVLGARPDDEEVELTWAKPAEGTSAISGYDYRSSTDNGVNWSDWMDTEREPHGHQPSAYTVGGLSNGDAYTFQVRAVSDAGEGPESNPRDSNADPRADDHLDRDPLHPLALRRTGLRRHRHGADRGDVQRSRHRRHHRRHTVPVATHGGLRRKRSVHGRRFHHHAARIHQDHREYRLLRQRRKKLRHRRSGLPLDPGLAARRGHHQVHRHHGQRGADGNIARADGQRAHDRHDHDRRNPDEQPSERGHLRHRRAPDPDSGLQPNLGRRRSRQRKRSR